MISLMACAVGNQLEAPTPWNVKQAIASLNHFDSGRTGISITLSTCLNLAKFFTTKPFSAISIVLFSPFKIEFLKF